MTRWRGCVVVGVREKKYKMERHAVERFESTDAAFRADQQELWKLHNNIKYLGLFTKLS